MYSTHFPYMLLCTTFRHIHFYRLYMYICIFQNEQLLNTFKHKIAVGAESIPKQSGGNTFNTAGAEVIYKQSGGNTFTTFISWGVYIDILFLNKKVSILVLQIVSKSMVYILHIWTLLKLGEGGCLYSASFLKSGGLYI